MTGREAVQFVAHLSMREVSRLNRRTPHDDDATLKLVCGWRLDEPIAFRELATLMVRPTSRDAQSLIERSKGHP